MIWRKYEKKTLNIKTYFPPIPRRLSDFYLISPELSLRINIHEFWFVFEFFCKIPMHSKIAGSISYIHVYIFWMSILKVNMSNELLLSNKHICHLKRHCAYKEMKKRSTHSYTRRITKLYQEQCTIIWVVKWILAVKQTHRY